MSVLFDLRDKIQDTEALIARLEWELPAFPNSAPLLINLKTLQRRREHLEAEFTEAANEVGLELCSYRLIPTLGRLLASGVGHALTNYQSMFSMLYDAIINGAKKTSKIGAEIAAKTGLELEYAFSGSIGFALTVPRDFWLLEESPFEETIRTVADIVRATRPDEIRPHAAKLGPAPIRSVFRWADGHVKASLGAEILWRRGAELKNSLLVQNAEFQRLQGIIAEMSDEEASTFEATGTLVMANIERRTFSFKPDVGDETIHGSFTDTIDESHPATLPKRCKVSIRKITKINYSTEDEKVANHLESLEAV